MHRSSLIRCAMAGLLLGLLPALAGAQALPNLSLLRVRLQHRENECEAGSRAMVEEMTKLGVDVTYIEVPGGSHTRVVVPNLPKAFEFLAVKKRTLASQ